MSLYQPCVSLFRKYGRAAGSVVAGVLNVVAPGSGALIEMAGKALDAAAEVAEETAEEQWEQHLLARLQQGDAERARLGQLLEYLAGPLSALCDKAHAFHDDLDALPDVLGRALASNPQLSIVLHQMNAVKEQFSTFQDEMRRMADQQQEAAPVYTRMNRVADYFDELWHAGIGPKDFVACVRGHHEAAQKIQQGDADGFAEAAQPLRSALPRSVSVCLLDAAAASRAGDYGEMQNALATAVRFKPTDPGLHELSRQATVLATRLGVQPKSTQPSSAPKPKPEPVVEKKSPQLLQPGDTLDGWLLQKRLGAGGWGQVFQAQRDGETKALKVMHHRYAADKNFVARFKQEIMVLSRLPVHTNLVRVEEFGYCSDRQTWYLTMEYVDGPTLESYLGQNGPLSEKQARQVFSHLIEGLAKAHAREVIHRDIKPGNMIFRNSDQRLVLVDFGLAVGVESFGQTKIGGMTVHFAAPEQHYGESASQASDVFSLCAVMHYALNYDKAELRKPNRFAPSLVPESLRPLLTRGLLPNASERWQNAGAMAAEMVGRGLDTEKKEETPQVEKQPIVQPIVQPTADPVTQYAEWKRQVEELKTNAQRAAEVYDWARAASYWEAVPHKHRDASAYGECQRKRDRLAELWKKVETTWRDLTEDELGEHLDEVLELHPDHPQGKPWIAQLGSKAERAYKRLINGKVGDVITNSLGMKFAWVPLGKSWLGGGDGKRGTQEFMLAQGLWCGVYPVTQAEWKTVNGDEPSHFKGNPRFPVEQVSWEDIQGFLEKLNAHTQNQGLHYRLPTEEEWEYICRGGPIPQHQSGYDFYFAKSKTDLTPAPSSSLSSTQANFNGNHPYGAGLKGPYREKPSDVGSYLPNPLGIYDLHGNVWEWTSTPTGGNYVLRGGSWGYLGGYCRAANRLECDPALRGNACGVRLVAVPAK